mgnify:CR=1 FL=1
MRKHRFYLVESALAIAHACLELTRGESVLPYFLLAASVLSRMSFANLNRRAYGFEIKKDFYKLAQEKIMPLTKIRQMSIFDTDCDKY